MAFLFTIRLSTNYKKNKKDSDLQSKTEQSTIPIKIYPSLCIHTQTHNLAPVRKSLHILKTIAYLKPPPPFFSEYYFDKTLKSMFTQSSEKFEKHYEIFEKQHE